MNQIKETIREFLLRNGIPPADYMYVEVAEQEIHIRPLFMFEEKKIAEIIAAGSGCGLTITTKPCDVQRCDCIKELVFQGRIINQPQPEIA